MSSMISDAGVQFADGSILPNVSAQWGFKNKIINGDFKIAQRGTSQTLTTSWAYGSVDRWGFTQPTATSASAFQLASGLTGFQFCARMGRTPASALLNPIQMGQALETVNSIPLQGKTVTLSAWVKAGANFSGSFVTLNLLSGTGTDQALSLITGAGWTGQINSISGGITPTTTWTRYQFTTTISSNITQLAVFSQYVPTGTAGADDNFYITGVQLEEGSVATPFEHRPITTELQLCQRYYQLLGQAMVGSAEGTTNIQAAEKLLVTMRAGGATIAIVAGQTASFRHSGADVSAASPTIVASSALPNGVWALIGGFTALTSGVPVAARNATASNLFLAASAEL